LNVKSSLSIGISGHLLLPKAVVHASVPHWTQALMPFNVKRRWRLETSVFDGSQSGVPRVSPPLDFDSRAVIKATVPINDSINDGYHGLPINRAHPLPF